MAARDSFEAYKELVTRFPDSKYSADANLRMRHIVNLLAKSELKVAKHYYNKGAYVAAVNRAQATVERLPQQRSRGNRVDHLDRFLPSAGLDAIE